MSKLIDKLNKLSQTAPQPMGFHTSKTVQAGSKILIIGRLKINSANPPQKISSEADAILVYTDATDKDIQKTAKAFGDIPWGVYLEESGDMEGLIGAGYDFVVFSPASLIADLPQDEKIGKIIQVESTMDDGLLLAVNSLPADAVLITDSLENNETLTFHQLMIYRHLANFIAKPLIVPVPASISEVELKALQDADIDGVIVEVEGENLKELAKAISKLPPRSKKKRDKGGVSLPRVGKEATSFNEEEEEDE
jgi:hypothetical protein